MAVTITQAQVMDWLPTLPDEYATAVFCDPPYGLSFMGKDWDHGVPSAAVWAELLRVCKPGAVLLAFGGTRTAHRLACNIEDAGWEIWDTFMWVYGSGFPKSHNIGKAIDREAGAEREVVGKNPNNRPNGDAQNSMYAGGNGTSHAEFLTAPATDLAATWDGYGTALKPAYEPVIMARKPRRGTYAQMAVEHGTGALWVDGCRVGFQNNEQPYAYPNGSGGSHGPVPVRIHYDNPVYGNPQGRWPANFALVHDERCNGDCHPDCPVRMLGEQSGESTSNGGTGLNPSSIGGNGIYGGGKEWAYSHFGDTGTAARFFYQAKASRREREAGLEDRPAVALYGNGGASLDGVSHSSPTRNHHPTVKPLAVCEYMARLIVPPEPYRDDAVLLVPYAGSGSEMIGAFQAGWRNVEGCEREAEYVEIARRRIAHWCQQGVLL